jgi:cytochrome c-type biogenesis protein CcmH
MPKWKISLVAAVLAAASLAQTSSGIMSAEAKRVAGRLACLCRTCKNTVGDCPMLQCHYSLPAREKIAAMQTAGSDDQRIVDAFVKEEGKEALAAPPTEGFSLLAWWMPFVAIGMGLGGIWLAMRRFLRPSPAAPAGDAALLARYQDQIDKDLSKLE